MAADGMERYWVAHDFPERAFAFGMWLCDCEVCMVAMQAEAIARPDTALVMKASMGRFVVTVVEAVEAFVQKGSLDALLWRPGDYLREVFVAAAAMRPGREGG